MLTFQPTFANVSKTPEQVSAASLLRAILDYTEDKKVEPTCWHDLESLEKSNRSVKIIRSKTPGFMKKYKFIPVANMPRFRNGHGLEGEFRVIAMGTDPREETPGTNSGVESRILIVCDGVGNYSVGQYSEVGLQRVFNEAGFDLKDFTGPNGKWNSEPSVSLEGEEGNRVGGNSSNNDFSILSRNPASQLHEDPPQPLAHPEHKLWWSVSASALVLLALLVFVRARRKKS